MIGDVFIIIIVNIYFIDGICVDRINFVEGRIVGISRNSRVCIIFFFLRWNELEFFVEWYVIIVWKFICDFSDF